VFISKTRANFLFDVLLYAEQLLTATVSVNTEDINKV
jgi:hypothetical protein